MRVIVFANDDPVNGRRHSTFIGKYKIIARQITVFAFYRSPPVMDFYRCTPDMALPVAAACGAIRLFCYSIRATSNNIYILDSLFTNHYLIYCAIML